MTGFAVVLIAILMLWFLFFRSPAPTSTNNPGGPFGTPANTSNGTGNTTPSNGSQPISTSGQASQHKIFQITPGPVVGATLIQTLHPTTTLARYIRQEDGHVFDLPLDVPGVVPHVVSNVTIPGGARAIWVEGGNAAVMQYLDGDTVKSVYLGFPAATSTGATLPTRIKFLPDAIVDLAASPDGKSVIYLLKTSAGTDGYVAKADGTGSKKVFSLPLSQILISWPSQGTLMAQTKSAAGVPGIVFSVDVKSGATTPLVYAQGLTATADASFSTVLYQISDGAARTSYLRDVKNGFNAPLPINPSPEQCIWSYLTVANLFCAGPIQFAQANYLDLWHQGLGGSAENIFKVYTNIAAESVVASPGGVDGGVQSDILEMALSPDEHYLSFTTKGARSLWGVRLSQ